MPATVWIHDPEAHIQRLLEVNLARAGYTTRVFQKLSELVSALRNAAEAPPDAVVFEYYLSDADITDVVTAASKREVPTIALSNRVQDADVWRGWQSGVDCYLSKPFNPMEVLTHVKRVLDSGQEDRPRI
jgi:two-component system alkaline phosphatase synthesis response regulator PhoP/two-component system response regulator VicR